MLRALLPGAPIIFFTGDDVDDRSRALVDAVLSKPVTRLDLAALIAQIEER
ncbi:MAG: hypothetical protein H5U40_00980 [Polyangiaceae bacterium]|nr:hypothetical protein [Polyangiaceae bacterium]